ncbi:MAG: hypothetical protein ACK5P7_12640 [Bdellovibrio sp.]
MKIKSSFALALALLSLSSVSLATDGLFTSIHHQYQSPRALGMGDAFVAVANDYSALFYNPAGLARIEEGQINLSIDAAVSQDFLSFQKDIQDASAVQGSDADKAQAYIELLQKNYGKNFSLRTGLFEAIWVRPGWGLGFIPVDLTLDMSVHNQAAPSISARTYIDSTFAYGFAGDVKDESIAGRLSWGVTTKFVNRGYFSKDVNALDLVADSNIVRKEDLREGYTVDADLGLLWTPYISGDGFWSLFQLARPTFGAVLRNAAETGFGQSLKLINKDPNPTVATDPPEKLHRVLDLGTRWEYPSFWIFGGRGVMDVRDIGHPSFSARKGLHAGFEFDWAVTTWWRGQYRVGLNQGYFTAGLSALFTMLRLDAVTYGEDVGSFNFPKENRVYLVKANIDL